MNTPKLPPLPDETVFLLEPYAIYGYTEEQMQAYAIAAIQAQGVSDGWAPTDAELTGIYKKGKGKAQPLTTQRLRRERTYPRLRQ